MLKIPVCRVSRRYTLCLGVLLRALTNERNLFCLPEQKRFLLAFWSKIGQIEAKSGFKTVDQPSGSPIFSFQTEKMVKNGGVLFAFLFSVKKSKKRRGGWI